MVIKELRALPSNIAKKKLPTEMCLEPFLLPLLIILNPKLIMVMFLFYPFIKTFAPKLLVLISLLHRGLRFALGLNGPRKVRPPHGIF